MESTLNKCNCIIGKWNVCNETCPYYGCPEYKFEDKYLKTRKAVYEELSKMGYKHKCGKDEIPMNVYVNVCEKLGVKQILDLDEFYELYGLNIE